MFCGKRRGSQNIFASVTQVCFDVEVSAVATQRHQNKKLKLNLYLPASKHIKILGEFLKMSSSEEDYMSDKFLSECSKNTRPGLVRSRPKQREIEVAKKKAKIDEEHRKSSKRTNFQERLEEGLNTAISSDNKGYALLAKMGYKAGQALGKNSTPTVSSEEKQEGENSKRDTNALLEPIKISLKTGRCGLGREAAIKELNEKRRAIAYRKFLEKSAGKASEINVEEYRKRMTQKAEEKFILATIKKCQSVCFHLDNKNNVSKPEMKWFWPKEDVSDEKDQDKKNTLVVEAEKSEDEEEPTEDEYEDSEKLDMLSLYLRTSYSYCVWCGTQYYDVDDLMEDCPGPYKENH